MKTGFLSQSASSNIPSNDDVEAAAPSDVVTAASDSELLLAELETGPSSSFEI